MENMFLMYFVVIIGIGIFCKSLRILDSDVIDWLTLVLMRCSQTLTVGIQGLYVDLVLMRKLLNLGSN